MFARIVNFILTALFWGVMTYILVGYFTEKPFLRYPNLPFAITKKVLLPGEIIEMRAVRCNDSLEELVYPVTREIVNLDTGKTYQLTAVVVSTKPGCSEIFSRTTYVPQEAAAGTYQFRGVAVIEGRFHTWLLPYESEPFKVVAQR